MIERYFSQPAVLSRMRAGIMSNHLDALAAELDARHYSRKSIRRQLRNSDAFGYWLAEQRIPITNVTEAIVARYTEPMHRCPGPSRSRGYRPHNSRGLSRLLDLLRRQEIIPSPVDATPPGPSGRQHWLRAFDQYLESVAGVTRGTRRNYLGLAGAFLKAIFGDGQPDFSQIQAEHVAAYVQARAEKRAPTCRKDPGSAVLAFLRFLTGAGLASAHLQYAIPRVRQWTHAGLPRFLTTSELDRVLAVPVEPTAKGLRERAVLFLLIRLGLRAGEVVRIQLDDIDWRAGNVLIRAGKARRERVLPLPVSAGEAIVHYLKEGRPASTHRQLFLNLCPPHAPLTSSGVPTGIAKSVLRRAGVPCRRPGAHVFRHTIATHLVWRGTTFKEIADVLGHRSLVSTAIYAKLDFPSLAQIAGPWPGGVE